MEVKDITMTPQLTQLLQNTMHQFDIHNPRYVPESITQKPAQQKQVLY